MEPWTAAGSASTERSAVVDVAAIKVAVVEVVAIDDCSAVRNVGVVMVDYLPAVPVVSPVMPAPTIATEKAHAKAEAE